MIRTNVFLTDDQYETIHSLAETDRKPAAQVIRDLLDEGLARHRRAVVDIKSLRGAAGRLPKPMSWDEMVHIAHEDALADEYATQP